MSIGPVPFSEIKAYLDIFHNPDPATFIRLIQAQDRVYIEHYASQR